MAIGVIAVEQLFGFVGLIVAVPILGTIKILIEELWISPLEENRRDQLVEGRRDQPVEEPAQIAAVRDHPRVREGGT